MSKLKDKGKFFAVGMSAIISGLMGLLAYAVPSMGWIMWVAWVPLIFMLDRQKDVGKWSTGFFAMTIALELSIGIYLVLLAIQSWMIYFAVVFPILLALLIATIWWHARKTGFGLHLFIMISFIAMLDFLIALSPITAVISPAITQGGFPFLLSPASLFGFPFITLLLLLFNGLAAYLLGQWQSKASISIKPVILIGVILVLAFVIPAFFTSSSTTALKIGALDAGMIEGGVHNPPESLGLERGKLVAMEGLYADLTAEAADSGADIIIWSEKFLTADPMTDAALKDRIETFASAIDSTLIVTYESDQKENIAVPVFPQEGFGELYQKTNIANVVGEDLVAGEGQQIYTYKGLPFGVLICYDMHFEENTRHLVEGGAEMVLVTSNAGDMHNSRGWVARTASLRAAESHIPFVVATDIGAYFVDAAGRIVAAADGVQPSVLMESMAGHQGATVYTRFGGHFARWLLIPMFFTLFLTAVIQRFLVQKRQKAFSEEAKEPAVSSHG